MGLDIRLRGNHCKSCDRSDEVFSSGITHNLRNMAIEAKIYEPLWHPERLNITKAKQLRDLIVVGFQDMVDREEHYRTFNPPNGWGSYSSFVYWLRDLIEACEKYPEADTEVST